MWIITLLVLIFILGIIILVHELGHFLWAKHFGVFIYEFSIGMGPILFTHKGKDGIDYNIRAIPIGGFVAMAGEVYDDDDKIPKDKLLCHKPWWQRLIILAAGVMNNFILALFLLFLGALLFGGQAVDPIVAGGEAGYPIMLSGIETGDTILEVNDHKVSTWDVAKIYIVMKNDQKENYYFLRFNYENNIIIETPIVASANVKTVTLRESLENDEYVFDVVYNDNKTDEVRISPIVLLDEDKNSVGIKEATVTEPIEAQLEKFKVRHTNGEEENITIALANAYESGKESDVEHYLGVNIDSKDTKSFFGAISYAFKKFGSIVHSMILTIWGLITGKISFSALSGPVGIYRLIGESMKIGIDYIIYVVAFLSLNVGVMNILPFPAFDGGHIFFVLVEKIKGSPVNSKFENICHTVGFILLMLLTLVITIQDIFKLF